MRFTLLALLILCGCTSILKPAPAAAPAPDMEYVDTTPLIQQSAHGNAAEVKKLIEGGAPLNTMSPNGITALMAAARKNHPDIVEQLLIAGADPKIQDGQGSTALHYAALGNSPGSVALLAKKADFEVKDSFDLTPLMMAVRFGSLDTVKAFLKAGASVRTTDSNGWNALFFSIPRGDSAIFDVLIDKYPNAVEKTDSDGDTLLSVAIQYEQPSMVKRLIEAGTPLQLADHDGNTPLHQAVTARRPEYVTWLLAAHADTNAQNKAGETPLMLAVKNQDKPLIVALVKAGADPDIKDELGNTCRTEADRMQLPADILNKDAQSL